MLRDEIVPYIDGIGLVSPSVVLPGTGRASGNGPSYTSEYYVLLNKNNQLVEQDKIDFANKIGSCIDENGLLNRAPVGTDPDQEGNDDYYATLNACKSLGNSEIPKKYLNAMLKYKGFLNNTNPGKWTLNSFLVRQPQLMACIIAAAFPSLLNPFHWFIRFLCFPLFLINALIILFNCMFTAANNSDSRRLGWHVWQTLCPVSLLCRLAGKVWLRRLYKTYPNGMKDVAKIYYQAGHPFSKYWVSE